MLPIGSIIFRGATEMTYTCPVCGFQNLPYPPLDYEICPSCGTEFEYDDARRRHVELRERWVHDGAPWHSIRIPKPYAWNAWVQLLNAGFGESVPLDVSTSFSGSFQETEGSVPESDVREIIVSMR